MKKYIAIFTITLALCITGINTRPAHAWMEPTIGEVALFAGNFAPRGWAFCNGQLLQISQYSALFSILGTNYGGDGRTTFGLPDLRGRVAISQGQGPGLPSYRLGQMGGNENVPLTTTQIPAHNHTTPDHPALATSDNANTNNPAGSLLAATGRAMIYNNNTSTRADMGDGSGGDMGTTGDTGGSQSHPNMQPYLGLNYIIALQGIFPSRN